MGRRPHLLIALALGIAALIGLRGRAAEPLIEVDGAFVRAGDGTWTVGNPQIEFEIGGNNSSAGVRGIRDPQSGRDWHRTNAPDAVVTINGQRIELGGAGTQFESADTTEYWGGVKLDLHYRLPAAGMEVIRSYVCYTGSPVIETWTTMRAGTRTVTASDLWSYTLDIPNGTLGWITGMGTPEDQGGAFSRMTGDLDDGQNFAIGSDNRAAEQNMPWFSVKADDAQFFGALLWSGAWRFQSSRHDDTMSVGFGMQSFTTSIGSGASLELPHAVFGFTTSLLPDTSMALHEYIGKGLRRGRTLPSYVTYNTWYSFGTFLDQPSLLAEMDTAKNMGVEQFVIDAGWWFHINPDDSGDFKRNWGNWEVDPERFPDGLGALRDHAHQLGMRFGVWVEPERVDRDTVGQPGLAKERFLAMNESRYDPGMPNSEGTSAQICLVDPEARAWVLEKLVHFIDDVQPDYLKWDNNFWVSCDRPGHGHGVADGGFRHHQALEELLGDLRGRYPDLDIENCASGGNRMSLGMLRYSDSAWVDDRTDPSARVRHNLEGLSALLPAPYLLTFALSTEAEPVTDDPAFDLPKIIRSRMTGMLGFSWMAEQMGEGLQAALQNQVSLLKIIRPTIQDGSAVLLSRQVGAADGFTWTGWDVVEHVTPKGDAVLMGFESNDNSDVALVKPVGLRPDAMYGVESADYGPLSETRGSELMTRGIEMQPSSLSRSHVLILRVR